MADVDVSKLSLPDNTEGLPTDRVYKSVKAAIMKLDFAPGATIRKAALCDWFQVSRSPVADALNRLSVEGLVDIVPQSGTHVAKLSMRAIREDAFLREALEVASARHAAGHRSEKTIQRLTRNIEMQTRQVEDADIEEAFETDVEFHRIIMETTRVSRLPTTVRTLSPNVDRARLLMVPAPSRLADTIVEHKSILDAIKRSDGDAAANAMRQHVRQLVRRLEPLEAVRPDIFSH
ncbi:MAG: GntR family transcriptional regulator [Devosiaceae bacterium]|nr:GntR family transcriptional regulator [Devosiaceae bacterium MH13]